MTVYTIPAKMSGTGTIHDTASQFCDREIDFGEDGQYAIVLASYYGQGGDGIYYIAKDEDEAIQLSESNAEYSHVIIDAEGNHYESDGDRLRRS